MDKYTTVIYWSDEDDRFIAVVPALPGCTADGVTRTEALLALDRIVEEWVETAQSLGRPIPKDKKIVSFQ